jgi:hypothetical protein
MRFWSGFFRAQQMRQSGIQQDKGSAHLVAGQAVVAMREGLTVVGASIAGDDAYIDITEPVLPETGRVAELLQRESTVSGRAIAYVMDGAMSCALPGRWPRNLFPRGSSAGRPWGPNSFSARRRAVSSSADRLYLRQASSRLSKPTSTAAATTALRRITQRLVSAVGKSCGVKGTPSGPTRTVCIWSISACGRLSEIAMTTPMITINF